MSKYYTTVYNKKSRMLAVLRDCYRAVRAYHGTLDQLCKRRNEKVYLSSDFQTLPQYEQSYIRGYDSCLFHTLQDDILYCRVWDNIPMTPKEIREYKKDWSMEDWQWLETLPQGSFWADTRKPFMVD